MTLEILHVPGCPGADLLETRLAGLLAGRPGLPVVRRLVTTRRVTRRRPASRPSSWLASRSAPGHPGTCKISRVMVGSISLVPHG